MRPFLYREGLWIYPVYGAVGASFGYWITGVDQAQTKVLAERKEAILAKRARWALKEKELGATEAAREAAAGGAAIAS
jgi:hypothetical protein